MDYDVDLLLDQTLGIPKEDKLKTSQLDAEEAAEVELATKQLQENGEDPAMQIRILLPSFPEPIVLRNKVSITIGRADRQRNAVPTLDLSGENALALGVSRLHAKILYIDSRFHLKDMGSTNGTWLNQIRLDAYQMVPLDHGDEIRLGQLKFSIL
jgi:pSer/pThr/pTyr-binding forkhead associated (FHA) protein